MNSHGALAQGYTDFCSDYILSVPVSFMVDRAWQNKNWD